MSFKVNIFLYLFAFKDSLLNSRTYVEIIDTIINLYSMRDNEEIDIIYKRNLHSPQLGVLRGERHERRSSFDSCKERRRH